MPHDLPLHTQVDDALASLTPAPSGLIVALSGGVDSCVLLELAGAWASERGVGLSALHVDHAMRESSVVDARFCVELCARMEVELTVVRLDPAPTSQSSARDARRRALAREARTRGADTILTAHHADDALETALINLIRGTSARGLSSLFPRTSVFGDEAPGLRLCRPLARASRASIESHWGDRAHAVDPSNEGDAYLRNRLRHHVLPTLLSEPGGRAGALSTLANLAQVADALGVRAERMRSAWIDASPERVSIALDDLLSDEPHDAELAEHWRVTLRGHLVGCPAWSAGHVRALTELAREAGGTPRRITLPGTVASRHADTLTIERTRARGTRELDDRRAAPVRVDVRDGGAIGWYGATLSWDVHTSSRGLEVTSGPNVTMFDLGELPDTLELRGPREGERLRVEDGSRRRLKELMRASGTPAWERWRMPCLSTPEGELVWVCGVRRSGHAMLNEGSERVVVMRWQPAESERK